MNRSLALFFVVTFISLFYASSGQTCRTCRSIGVFCGNWSDGCNRTINCGPPCYTITTCNGQFFGQALTANSAPAEGIPVIVAGIPVEGPLLNQRWIINGTYIHAAQDPEFILGWAGNELRLYNKSAMTVAQAKQHQWALARNLNGTCGKYLASLRNPFVMDVYKFITSTAAAVILYPQKQLQWADNQLFDVKRAPTPGAWVFVSKQNGHVLTVNGSLSDGAAVVRSPLPTTGVATLLQQWKISLGVIQSIADPNFRIGYSNQKVPNVGFTLRVAHNSLLTATQSSNYQWIVGSPVSSTYSYIYNTPFSTPVATVVPFNGVPLLQCNPITTSSSLWQAKVVN